MDMDQRRDEGHHRDHRRPGEVQYGHRDVDEGHRHAHHQEIRHHRIEEQDGAAFLRADLAHDHRRPGRADRRRQRREMAGLEGGAAGPQHHHDPEQPDPTASDRRQPTRSPRTGIASSVISSGEAKMIA